MLGSVGGNDRAGPKKLDDDDMPVNISKAAQKKPNTPPKEGGYAGGASDSQYFCDQEQKNPLGGPQYGNQKGDPHYANPIPVADQSYESHSIAIPHGGGILEELKTATGKVLIKHKDGSVENKSEEIAVTAVTSPHASVGVKMARTINTGNYESSKLEVSFYAPCDMNEDDINETFDFAVSWLDGKMNELITKYTG